MKTIIIDNYDSFTYNLLQQVAKLSGDVPLVLKNDEASFEEIMALKPDHLILSPGPGRPEKVKDFGVCRELILHSNMPILGVCLGLQGIAHVFGGRVVHAKEPFHGRLSRVIHNNQALFNDIPSPFNVVRYHSLEVTDLPDCLAVTAQTEDKVVMGLAHRDRPIWGVQFHPESIATEYGDQIINNFLFLAKAHKEVPNNVLLNAER